MTAACAQLARQQPCRLAWQEPCRLAWQQPCCLGSERACYVMPRPPPPLAYVLGFPWSGLTHLTCVLLLTHSTLYRQLYFRLLPVLLLPTTLRPEPTTIQCLPLFAPKWQPLAGACLGFCSQITEQFTRGRAASG